MNFLHHTLLVIFVFYTSFMEEKWKVLFYTAERNESPVEKFFYLQQPYTQAKMLHLFELLEKHGPHLGMPQSKHIYPKLYELRVRGKEEIRVLYTFLRKNIYLLHAFKKKTNKIPAKDLQIGIKRLTKYSI